MNSLLSDLRYAAREARHRPGFTLTAVLPLALGIAATSAVFSVIYAVLLDPLPLSRRQPHDGNPAHRQVRPRPLLRPQWARNPAPSPDQVTRKRRRPRRLEPHHYRWRPSRRCPRDGHFPGSSQSLGQHREDGPMADSLRRTLWPGFASCRRSKLSVLAAVLPRRSKRCGP